MHHRTLQAVINLRTGKDKPSAAATYLRNEATFPDQCAALAALCANGANPKNLPLITGTIFANDWSQIWQPFPLPKIEKGQKAINWHSALFSTYAGSISAHVANRDALTKAFMHGDFDQSKKLISEHIGSFGYTLWSTRWSLVLAEEMGGVTTREALRDSYRKIKSDYGNTFFSDLFSVAVDKSVTEDRYRALVRTSIPDGNIRPFLELIFLEELPSTWESAQVLQFFEWLPLIDRYELFARLAAFSLAFTHADAPRFAKALTRMSSDLSDPVIDYMASCTADRKERAPEPRGISVFGSWDDYLTSDYEQAINTATKISEHYPALFPPHELIVKSTMYLGKKLANKPTNPYTELQLHLFNLFSKNQDAEESLSVLLRMATRIGIPSLSAPLRSLNAQHSTPSKNIKWGKIAAYSCGVHGPRNFEQYFSNSVNLQYLRHCSKSNPDSVASNFFFHLALGEQVDVNPTFQQIPQIRKAFFGGISASRHGRYTESIQKLAEFESLQLASSSNPLSPFGIEEAQRILIDVHRLKGDVGQLQRLIVAAFMQRPLSVKRLPVQEAFEACTERRNDACKYIEYPIIAYLAASEPHQVSLCLKRFLRSKEIDLPSELTTLTGLDKDILGVLFLRVCTPDVLDSLDELDTVQKVDTQRIHLLEWVKANLPHIANAAKTEILAVTQNAELRDALENLNEAKVVLDLQGLRHAENERFLDAYNRFQAQKELGIARQTGMIVNALMDIRSGSAQPKVVQIPPSQHVFMVFASAFREIRDAFLSSPYYGLEACLSGQIRHGIIVQHIRNPFIDKKVAVKNSGIERQEFEKHWRTIFGHSCSDETVDFVVRVLADMTMGINEVAQEVKENWIQSKTESGARVGMFDFAFDDQQIEGIYRSFEYGDASFDSFLDNVFDTLLKSTREGLKNVRIRINIDLRKRLGELVDTAISKISHLDLNVSNPLRHALTVCRQEVESVVCAQMIRWFQESKTSLMGISDFDLIARTAVGMIERLNPNLRGRFKVEIDSEFRVRGRHFRALVLLIFFLLDNAAQHSNVSDDLFEASLQVTAKSNRLAICVKAQMDSVEGAFKAEAAIKERVAQHKRELVPEKVIREGGSGLAKVIATVVYEFDQDNPDIQASCHDTELAVTVISQMEGVAA